MFIQTEINLKSFLQNAGIDWTDKRLVTSILIFGGIISGVVISRLISTELKKSRELQVDVTRTSNQQVSSRAAISADTPIQETPHTKTDNLEWAIEESDNVIKLLVSIAQEQTYNDTLIHHSVSCNNCGMSPLRGIRFKCGNCIDYDLCSSCENLQVHFKTHLFLKIRIPIPPHSNPRSMIFKPLYPGNLWVNTPEIDTSDLEKITHFDSMEISALYEQFLAFSTVDQDGGIPRKTFESLFGTVQVKGNLLVDRIFKFFDQDLDGIISFDEMVRGMSILTKGSREEKINFAFRGYDLDGDGRITRDDLLQMFKAYFEISMELVRGSVKLIEEGMLEQFDDQDNKPVSAAFGAPTSLDTDSNHHTDLKDQSRLDLGSPNDFLFTRYEPTFNISPTKTLDLRPSLAFLGENDHVPVIENISQDAINEMIQIIFDQIENSHGEYLTLEDFIKAVDIDVNIIAWSFLINNRIETLGSVF